MQNDDGVENVLEKINYSFSLFCMKNVFFFFFKEVVVEVGVVDLEVSIRNVPTVVAKSSSGSGNPFTKFKVTVYICRYSYDTIRTLFNHGNLTHYTKNALPESREDKKLSLKSKIYTF